MFQQIEPYQFHNEFTPLRELTEKDYYIVVKGRSMLLKIDDQGNIELPSVKQFGKKSSKYLFCIDDYGFYELDQQFEGFDYVPIFQIRGKQPDWLVFAAVTAISLVGWYRKNKYCGCCATEMILDDKERMLKCPECGNQVYPRINPVVIVGIINKNKMLLTKYSDAAHYNHYALVAGFCEFGETLEQTLKREIREEVGLEIKNIHYAYSQPWPLSDSLIMGFYCELDGDDQVKFNDGELNKAVWASQDEIEVVETFSLTANLMADFKKYGREVLKR